MKMNRVISHSYRFVAWLMAGLVTLNITLALAQS